MVLLFIINVNDCQIEKSFNSRKMNQQYAQESLEIMLKVLVEWCRLHPSDDLVIATVAYTDIGITIL